MKRRIDHDTCSEQLLDYVRGGLGDQDRAAVEQHLAACAECSREHAALLALPKDDVEPLTEHERRRLRRGVLTAVTEEGSKRLAREDGDALRRATLGVLVPARTEATSAPSPWRSRLFPALGAAAIVVVVIAAIAYVGLIDDYGDGSEGAATRDAEELEAEGGGGQAGKSSFSRTQGPSAGPVFDARTERLQRGDLVRLGRTGEPFTTFARRYHVGDADRLRDTFLARLAQAAPAVDGEQVRTCAETVFASQDFEILPAYGALGQLDGRDVLVLGFVWSDDTNGSLSRFMIWAWQRGSCPEDPPVAYEAGPIKR